MISIFCLQEPDKPSDALNYLKNTVGGTSEDQQVIGNLRTENAELRAKVGLPSTGLNPSLIFGSS